MSRRNRLRKTKVVATLGPACDELETLKHMISAGMNVARLNASHGDHESHRERVRMVRRAAAELDANVAVMLDTKGMEIRTSTVAGGSVLLQSGQRFMLYPDGRPGDAEGVGLTYRSLAEDIRAGDRVLIDDGRLELIVRAVDNAAGHVETEVAIGGELKDRKGVNLPETRLHIGGLDEINQADLEFAAAEDFDYIAASFVRRADDVRDVRAVLDRTGTRIPVIAKIESREGVENLLEIVAEADGTMVARGDLGVECALEQVPVIQKKIIRTTVTNGKPVITATQMLDSMERNPAPTRAEVSDVANAILDGTSAVMLSGETAIGKYPVEAVRTMSKLALEAEVHLEDYGYLQKIVHQSANVVTEAVSQAAVSIAANLDVAAVFAVTESGFTARNISKHRPNAPIIALSPNREVVRRLAMNWGVTAMGYDREAQPDDDAVIRWALTKAKGRNYLHPGDLVVVTTGVARQTGSTNLIRVVTVE